MRQTLSRGVFAAAAATGMLSLYGTSAIADTQAEAVTKDSPGVLSGNAVQVPIKVPLNLCGNTVDVAALLNKAFGNSCANTSDKKEDGSAKSSSETFDKSGKSSGSGKSSSSSSSGDSDGYGDDTSGAHAEGVAKDSPGVLSGNSLQVPVDLSVNVCGNAVDILAVFNEAADDTCSNRDYGYGTEVDTPAKPSAPSTPATPAPPRVKEAPRPTPPSELPPMAEVLPGEVPQLAETGSGALMAASAASAALLAGGVLVYRRSRATSHR
ncbi:chaplin [Streptomyces sp. NPDC127197]|uniref:chaplin n=1 Tax=Streptomyces sp. NPDC127197 TaxID=3345388 RepID=UPI00362E2C3A